MEWEDDGNSGEEGLQGMMNDEVHLEAFVEVMEDYPTSSLRNTDGYLREGAR